ncbi:uncharacterized protein LOC107879059 [Capsicum annuum]|uniref:uncharacterized protein LOC107879059 n=1 Tax=Capsicum annuum TaxID=4072 RepID=UPI001FB05196|nr:uncharacterized protein LOC107879059 [Capsicum annuum]
MPPPRAHGNNNQPQPVDPLHKKVSHTEFWAAFQMLAQAVTTNTHTNASPLQENNSAAALIHDFMQKNPPKFYGSRAGENPQMYIDEMKKITQIMYVTKEEYVELDSYRLKDVFYDWMQIWNKGREEDTAPSTWQELENRSVPSRSQDSVNNRPHPPSCAKCGKDHFGECYMGQWGCFSCGKLGHILKDCPYTRQQSRDARPPSQATSAPPPAALPVPPKGASSSTAGV